MPTTTRSLQRLAYLVCAVFSIQITCQDLAFANQSQQMNQAYRQAIGAAVEKLNGAQSWDDLFSAMGPLPSYVTGTLKTMLYGMVPNNFEPIKVAGEGLCKRGLSKMFQWFGGASECDADLMSAWSVWGAEQYADGCAQRVLKQADQLTFPVLKRFKPTLTWDGEALAIGDAATVRLAADRPVLTVEGTAAKVYLRQWGEAMASPDAGRFLHLLNGLQNGIHQTKSSVLLKNFFEGEAFAAAPLIFPIITLICMLCVILLQIRGILAQQSVKEVASEIELYDALHNKLDRRIWKGRDIGAKVDVQDLVLAFIDRPDMADGAGWRRLVENNNHGEANRAWKPDDDFEISTPLRASWSGYLEGLVRATAQNEPEQLKKILNYLDDEILWRPLDEEMLQATHQILRTAQDLQIAQAAISKLGPGAADNLSLTTALIAKAERKLVGEKAH